MLRYLQSFQKAFFSHQLNSKNNSPVLLFKTYLGVETVFRRLLQRMARMDMVSKLKTLDQLLQILMLCLTKSPIFKNSRVVLPGENRLIFFLHNSTGSLLYG